MAYLSQTCPLEHTACLRSVKGKISLHKLQCSGKVCLFIFFRMCPISTWEQRIAGVKRKSCLVKGREISEKKVLKTQETKHTNSPKMECHGMKKQRRPWSYWTSPHAIWVAGGGGAHLTVLTCHAMKEKQTNKKPCGWKYPRKRSLNSKDMLLLIKYGKICLNTLSWQWSFKSQLLRELWGNMVFWQSHAWTIYSTGSLSL